MKTREKGTNWTFGLNIQPQILIDMVETLDQMLRTALVLDCSVQTL